MKERFWKQLKQQLCPLDKWIKDQSIKKCHCCSKQFITLIRRKHHCRFCGNIFCSDCSNFFINGNYIGSSQKFVRHCQLCHHKVQRFIRDRNKIPQQDFQQAKQWNQHSDQQSQQQDNFNLNKIFAQVQKNSSSQISQKLDQQLKQTIKSASKYLCTKFQVNGKLWCDKIAEIAFKGAIQTKMDVFTNQNNQNEMDIAKQVRFKTIITPQNQISCLIMKGIILQKNLPTKNMINYLKDPKILIIQKSIDTDSLTSFLKFQQLVKNQKQIMKKILDKIIKLNPDIIFVQNSISMFALEYLQEKKIVIISKIKYKDLQAIKLVCKIKKSIKKLWMIDKYKSDNIIGSCDKIYFKSVKENQSLMIIQGEVGIRSIILGQNTQQTTSLLKKSLQILLRLARQLYLQKFIITTDLQMMTHLHKKPKFSFISNFLLDKPIDNILKQQITLTNVRYSSIKLLDAPKNYIEYASRQGKSSMKEVCGQIKLERRKIYSSEDITLGNYILLTVANSQKICKECQFPHCQSFYIGNTLINIQTQKTQSNNNKQSFIDNIQNQQALTLQNLNFFLKKQKQLIIIQTYLRCNNCMRNICHQPIRVGNSYLENSFYNFLMLLTQFYLKDVQKGIMKNQRQRKPSFRQMQNCNHEQDLIRIFQYSNTLIKFTLQKTMTLQVDYINIKSQQSSAQIATYDQIFIKNTYQIELLNKKTLLEKIYNILISLPFPNNNNTGGQLTNNSYHLSLTSSISNKTLVQYGNYLKIKQILEKTRQNLTEIQGKSIKYMETLGHDWTIFMRQIYKIQSILKPVTEIIQYFESLFKKEKLDQSLMIKQQQPQLINTKSDQVELLTKQQTLLKKDGNNKIDRDLDAFSKRINKCRYPRTQGTFLYFNPIYTFDPVSVIASGLNSPQFNKSIKQQSIPNQLKLKLTYNKKIKTNWQLKQDLDQIYSQLYPDNQKDKIQTYQLTIFYHNQFQQLRQRQGISLQLFVRSMCGCRSWESSGGKSLSKFAKSHNQLIVVKIINDKQFVQFQRFSPSYLNHIKLSKNNKQDSLLAKIYGIYEVSMRGNKYNCIVMQNIFFGLNGNLRVYDLKGSQVNRLNLPAPQVKNITGQDTNFKIDRDGQPIIIPSIDYDKIIKILQLDAIFLKEQAVIDYSLLIILTGKKIRMGIIDFMRPYHFPQRVQNIIKQLRSGRDPTVIPPQNYAQRFITAMKKYFIKVENY